MWSHEVLKFPKQLTLHCLLSECFAGDRSDHHQERNDGQNGIERDRGTEACSVVADPSVRGFRKERAESREGGLQVRFGALPGNANTTRQPSRYVKRASPHLAGSGARGQPLGRDVAPGGTSLIPEGSRSQQGFRHDGKPAQELIR